MSNNVLIFIHASIVDYHVPRQVVYVVLTGRDTSSSKCSRQPCFIIGEDTRTQKYARLEYHT